MSYVFPSNGLVRLIYVSRSQIPPSDLQETIRQILIKSISNNRKVDVTGQLLSRGGYFMQLLEGPAAGVRETYDRVAADPRHSDVGWIDVCQATERLFRDWNMSQRQLADQGPGLADLDAV